MQGFFLARPHLRKKDRRRYSKCLRGWEIGSFADKQCRVGTWSEVGGCFAANAAGGMLSMAGMADASACGGACGAVFPQMRPGDVADGGGRWTRRHVEGRARLVCRKCGWGMRPRAGKDGRVGKWSEVGGCFAANAAVGNAGDDGDCSHVGMWNEVGGRFSANAAGGMLAMTGRVDASACGLWWEGVFPQMRLGGCGRGRGKVDASACGKACRAGLPQMRPGRGCRERMPERMPGEDTDRMPGGGAEAGSRKRGTGSTEQEQGAEQGTGAGNRSREPERGKGAVSGFLRRCRDFLLF